MVVWIETRPSDGVLHFKDRVARKKCPKRKKISSGCGGMAVPQLEIKIVSRWEVVVGIRAFKSGGGVCVLEMLHGGKEKQASDVLNIFGGGGWCFPKFEQDRSPKNISEQTTTTWRTPLRPSGEGGSELN